MTFFNSIRFALIESIPHFAHRRDDGPQKCTRTNKVHTLTIEDTSDPAYAYWTELTGPTLTKAVSSHTIVRVPKTYVALKCKIT